MVWVRSTTLPKLRRLRGRHRRGEHGSGGERAGTEKAAAVQAGLDMLETTRDAHRLDPP